MYKPTDSDSQAVKSQPATGSGRVAVRIRNARARKKLERRRDQELLRSHIEEVWTSATTHMPTAAGH